MLVVALDIKLLRIEKSCIITITIFCCYFPSNNDGWGDKPIDAGLKRKFSFFLTWNYYVDRTSYDTSTTQAGVLALLGISRGISELIGPRSEPPMYLPTPCFVQYMYVCSIFRMKSFVTRDDTQPLSSALLARASLFSKHIDRNSLFAHIYCN